jgi:hypothetical protein
MTKEDKLKGHALRGYIRKCLIRKGKYSEENVERVFNDVTSNGTDFSGFDIVTSPARVKELNGILASMIGHDMEIKNEH